MTPRCPICGDRDSAPAFAKEGFDHYSCAACEALYLFPVPPPEELARYYVGDGDLRSRQCWDRSGREYSHYEPIWEEALDWIERRSGRGPLLDVGCGGGQFLAFARRRGWSELEGIEVSPEAAAQARERSGAEVRVLDFAASGLRGDRYAGVTCWNVIEHAPAPRAFVREAARLLRRQGVFVADCPNRYGLTLRLLGRRAHVVMPPEHLTYFCHRSLRRLLEEGGLRVERLGSNTVYVANWVRWLARPRDEAAARRTQRAWYARLVGSGAGRLSIAVANRLLAAARLGDQMFAVASKP